MQPYPILERGIPLQKASQALILLHGRGGSAEDILQLGEHLAGVGTYIVAPEAPHNAWYPNSFMEERDKNEPRLSSAIDCVHHLIQIISEYIDPAQIALAGFSQGACLALEASARLPQRYRGVIAFTGGLIGKTVRAEDYPGNLAGTPVFIGTTEQDPHIPLSRAEESASILQKMGGQVTISRQKSHNQ